MKTVQIQLSVTLDDAAAKTFTELIALAIKQATGSWESEVKKYSELLTQAIKQTTGSSAGEVQEYRNARHRASQASIFAREKAPTDLGMLIDSEEAFKLLKVSKRTLIKMYTTGKMPPPFRIGRAIRWRFDVLKKWVEAGCPVDSRWRS